MADLTTTYMGIKLENPIIAGASELTSNMNSIKKIEDSGAGALVIKSLFEEQIQLEMARFDEEQQQYDGFNAEMSSIYPKMEHAGPEEHLMWVRRAKESVGIPVIASLNAVNDETWVQWAVKLEQTGVDGLELNFFATPDRQEDRDIEESQAAVVKAVRAAVKIPVSIKMSLFYTSPAAAAKRFDKAGAGALVLFNRMFHPDLDVEKEEFTLPFNLSTAPANRLPLRYVGLLYGETQASLCASSGIMDGLDAAKILLAGADAMQVVSTLYRNKITQISRIVQELEVWMGKKGYSSLKDFQGKMSKKNITDPWTYKRAQYTTLLMKPDPLGLIR